MSTSSKPLLLTKNGGVSVTSLKSSTSDGGVNNESGDLSNNSNNKLRQVNHNSSEQKENENDPTTIALKNLLDTMQVRFEQMSNGIISRIDEMGNKIDDLERTLAEITAQMESQNQLQNSGGNGNNSM